MAAGSVRVVGGPSRLSGVSSGEGTIVGLEAQRSLAVAGPIVPQTGRVLKSATPAPAFNPPDPNHLERLQALVARAKVGDPTAMPEIRELLKTTQSLFQALGDIAGNALVSWIRRYAGDDLIQADAVSMQMDQLRDELTESNDGPLEKLIVEQLLVTHIQTNYRSTVLAQTDSTHVPTLGYIERQLDRATRRFAHLARNLKLLRGARRKTRTPPQRVAGKRSAVPLRPEPFLPTFAVNNRIRELVAEAG